MSSWPKKLPNNPLVEAILEVRWGDKADPAYPVLVGQLYEKVKHKYPEIEDLPIGQVPAELTAHMVRHRFRASKEGWPLVQIGPGVISLNDTEGYHWDDFSGRARWILPALYGVYPKPEVFKLNNIMLRYINALPFDYHAEDLFGFLSRQMKTSLSLPPGVFAKTKVHTQPMGLRFESVFPMNNPKGALKLQFGTGKKKEQLALIWELQAQAMGEDVPQKEPELYSWLDQAHDVIEEWFYSLVEGDLLEGFLRS